MGDQKDTVVMGNYLKRIKRQVKIEANKRYKLLGVKWYGKGMFLREEKLGKEIKAKKLYRVQTGDFLYNRLFAWKSSFAIVEDDFDGCFVSNEFPTFEYDQQKINPYFLLSYILQPAYIDFVNRQSGGMSSVSRKRFKEEDFVRSAFPDYTIDQQRIIAGKINKIKNNLFDITLTFEEQLSYLSSLRQSVLQEAIEGKFTAEWRNKNHELISGDNHASKLLEKIKAEKEKLIKEGKIKKAKPILPITDEEKLFDLPDGWAWCRLGEVCEIEKGNLGITKAVPGDYPLVALSEERLRHNSYQFDCAGVVIPLISSSGHGHASMKRIHYQEGKFSVGNILCCVFPKYKNILNMKFVYVYLDIYKERFFVKKMKGAANVSLSISSIAETPIPLIPIDIQNRYQTITNSCDNIEKQVFERREQLKMLMQSVLREAFKG